MSETRCRVCGLDAGEVFRDDDGQPTYAICDCCGSESGVNDLTTRSARAYRRAWLAEGSRWFSPDDRPTNWDLAAQLAAVPREYA